MEKEILKAWDENSHKIREWLFSTKDQCHSYISLIENTIRILFDNDDEGLDHERITEIDNGSYQGTLIFVISEKGYQPGVENHWCTYVFYGSCSHCDALLDIQYQDDIGERVQGYWTLCLHMMQKMKRIYGD